ncbi:hypothetical protein, partial [Morganella morganii]|uniref:hypothetical protein n=1 Tax=Morganella morganii TaxID=582 RepID=UPI00197B34A6
FPLEMRAVAISIFYAIGTGTGGFIAPVLFGWLIESGNRTSVAIGYAIGAALALLPTRNAGRGDLDLLCDRYRHRWLHCAGIVRLA